jgi:hypothetical protein
VRPTDPAVEPEQLDAVGVAAEDVAPGPGQARGEPGEGAGVSVRRRRRQRTAVVALHEPAVPAAELRERPEEPGVAEERRLLELLRRSEGGGRSARARRDRLERAALGPREPTTRGRQLLEQPQQRRAEQLERPGTPGRERRERCGVGCAEGSPGLAGGGQRLRRGGAPGGPQRLELARAQLAQSAKPRPARERGHDDQLGQRPVLVDQRQGVDQLQLVVQVVLEPEDDTGALAQRPDELAVTALERGADRAATPPAAAGEKRSPDVQQLAARPGRHRPLVEGVVPGQHGSADRGRPKRVAGALPVGHVQKGRRRGRFPPLPCEVGSAAGAVVQGVARTADDACELLPHPPQARDPGVDLVDLRRHPDAQRLGRAAGPPRCPEVLADLGQGVSRPPAPP